MKRILIVLYLLLGVATAWAQYPANLPSSGTISLQQVSNWMLASGEIGGHNYSVSYLNSVSHLSDKSAPYSLSDWYGYGCITNAGSVSGAPGSICDGSNVTYSLNGITGNFLRFQYQWNTTGGAWTDWGGTNPYTWASSNAGNTLYVRGVVGMGNCLAYSAAVGTTVSSFSVAPAGITGTTTVCDGTVANLTVSGGSLGTGASWKWYSGSCGGTFLVSGPTLSVMAHSTTSFYVRAEGTCNTTACVSATVTVNTLSTAPTGITGITSINTGASTTLSVSGGSLGTGANWIWYAGGCGGTSIGRGSSIVFTPSSTTTYYVRAEGSCGATACASSKVTVTACVSSTGSCRTSSGTIQNNTPVWLSVYFGVLATGATWEWRSDDPGTGTIVGTGTGVSVYPRSNTTTMYYLIAVGGCKVKEVVGGIGITTHP